MDDVAAPEYQIFGSEELSGYSPTIAEREKKLLNSPNPDKAEP